MMSSWQHRPAIPEAIRAWWMVPVLSHEDETRNGIEQTPQIHSEKGVRSPGVQIIAERCKATTNLWTEFPRLVASAGSP